MLESLLHWVTRGIEVAGIAVIVIGVVSSSAAYLWHRIHRQNADRAYHGFRADLGRSILLGLEFLVAADIIATVAIEPTLQSVAVLGGVVIIRTFLSFALEIEIRGQLPWHIADTTQKGDQS